MYLGSFQVGQEVTYRILANLSTGENVYPDAAPLSSVIASDGTVVFSGVPIPSRGYPVEKGLFEGRIFLTEAYSAGKYTVNVNWIYSGSIYGEIHSFTVIPGNGGSGQVTSMYYHQRPSGNYIVNGRDSGRIYKGKNPRV